MKDLKNILVGVDFSPCSAAALKQAMRIGAWNRSHVHVLHALETLMVMDLQEAMSVMQEQVAGAMKEEAQRAWTEFAAKIPGASGLPFTIELNSTTASVGRLSEELGAGLLVMGMHGVQKKSGAGPVASACVRRGPTDVLLVQGEHDRPYTTVVACVDFSETSLRAVDQGVAVAARDGATLYIVHAFTAPWNKPHLMPMHATPDLDNTYRAMLLSRLEAFCKPFEHELKFLKPRYQLIEASSHGHGLGAWAGQIGADLVVLGTRGQTNLRDMVLGSTAERVLRDAPCSVLAVKPRG